MSIVSQRKWFFFYNAEEYSEHDITFTTMQHIDSILKLRHVHGGELCSTSIFVTYRIIITPLYMDPVGNPITNYVFRHSIYDF